MSDLPTDRSLDVQIVREHPQPVTSQHQHLVGKINSHLAFMEKQFLRNMEWQKELINNLMQAPAPPKINKNYIVLQLTSIESEMLRENLQEWLRLAHNALSLEEMIKLASQMQIKSTFPLQFPKRPQVVTLQDLSRQSSSKQSHSQSERSLPKNMQQMSPFPPSRIPQMSKPPKNYYTPQPIKQIQIQDISKTPEIFISSPQTCSLQVSLERCLPVQRQLFESIQYDLNDSLGKRLMLDDYNLVTFRQKKGQKSQNVSFQLSQSNDDARSSLRRKLSELLHEHGSILVQQNQKSSLKEVTNSIHSVDSNNSPSFRVYMPTDYKQVQSSDEKVRVVAKHNWNQVGTIAKEYNQKKFLCFRQEKKRRKSSKFRGKSDSFENERAYGLNMKNMHDSFGQSYQEYVSEQVQCNPTKAKKKLAKVQRETFETNYDC